MNNLWLYGKVVEGTVLLKDIALYHNLISELDGKRIQIKITEYELDYTEKQLNTYFGVIIRHYIMSIPDFAGWTVKEIDNYFAFMFRTEFIKKRLRNSPVETVLVEQIIPIVKLSRSQFSKFIEEVILYLNQEYKLNIQIEDESKNKEN